MTETINGLHSCKPGNDPVVGQIKTFTVEHKPARNGKNRSGKSNMSQANRPFQNRKDRQPK